MSLASFDRWLNLEPAFLTLRGITFPAGGFKSRAAAFLCRHQESGFRCLRCAGRSSAPQPVLLGSNGGNQKAVYTDSSHYLFYPYVSPGFSSFASSLLSPKGTLNPCDGTSPPHHELLCFHYIPVLLHQPGSEASARLETRGWGGEVGGKGCGFSSEETEEEERCNGGAGESPQLPRTAQWVSRWQTLIKDFHRREDKTS